LAAKIFISYRRTDSAGYAGRVTDRLERESLRAQADSFGTALRLDLLTADDFR